MTNETKKKNLIRLLKFIYENYNIIINKSSKFEYSKTETSMGIFINDANNCNLITLVINAKKNNCICAFTFNLTTNKIIQNNKIHPYYLLAKSSNIKIISQFTKEINIIEENHLDIDLENIDQTINKLLVTSI